MAGQRNPDNAPVTSPDWSICAVKSLSFDGVNSGAIGAQTLFTVTGAVLLRLFGKVTSSLTATSRSPSASVSPSSSTSASNSPSASVSPSESRSPSSSVSPSSSPSISPSATPSNSPSASVSVSASISPSASTSISPSASISPSSSASLSRSPSSSTSPSASVSPSSSASPSPSPGSSGELSVGTATNITGIIVATEGYLLQNNRIWVDATPSTTVEPIASAPQNIVTENVILTVATAGIYGGAIDIYGMWYPLGQNSSLVVA